ncbi:hypothetical protein BaRGS_00032139 [Batillaria attramentaria]|uniref:peptidylprolyl isomerase n=1 Tax=Batillaria attramentaria TaxID=370345 RepID=A0ABD0JPI5_9CAEN
MACSHLQLGVQQECLSGMQAEVCRQDAGSVELKEPIDLHDLQDPQKGATFEVDQSSVYPDETTSNAYFRGEEVYRNLLRLDDDVAADVDNGMEPFDAMLRRMEDISGDGGVWKKVIKFGAGPLVPDGALVRIKYNAWKEYEDEPFDSSYLRNEVEKFRLGQDGSVPGMHIAVASMKKGEKSRFIFKPKYYYGKMGCGDRIPPDCTVLFEIELISFVERDGVDDYYCMTEEEKRAVTFEFVVKVSKAEREEGNQQFKAEMYHRAIGKYRRVYLNMAICHLKLRENGRAIHFCNQVLAMDNKSEVNEKKALYFKAKAKHSLGEFDDARRLFQQAQQKQGNSREIREALQKLEEDVKRFEYQYKQMCQRMVSLGPTSSDGDDGGDSGEGKKAESPKKAELRPGFKEAVWKQMENFRKDRELSELPFPDGQLTENEYLCIVEAVSEMNMDIQRRGTTIVVVAEFGKITLEVLHVDFLLKDLEQG